jgi:hypothetical protein
MVVKIGPIFNPSFLENLQKEKSLAIPIVFVILAIALCVVLFYVNKTSGKVLGSTTIFYTFMAVFMTILFVIFFSFFKTGPGKGGAFFVILLVFFSILYGIMTLHPDLGPYMYAVNGFMILMVVLFVVVGLAIFYQFFIHQLQNTKGIIGFVIQFLFFLPCLFTEFVEYLQYQFSITSPPIYILLAIECILLIVPMIVWPSIKQYIFYGIPSIHLVKDPVYLNRSTVIGNTTQLFQKSINDETAFVESRNYSFSFWIFNNMNARPIGAAQNLFCYGNGYPQIKYIRENQIEIQCNINGNEKGIIIDLPAQKWHCFVFNYKNTTADIFMNGEMISSFRLGKSLPVYSASDLVIIGDTPGIQGAICNIHYYSIPLSLWQIINMYNIYSVLEIPV